MWAPPGEHKVVGGILAAARKRQGLTQVELARRLEKPQSFVSAYEAGQRRVDVLELLRIAGAMGVVPGELFKEIEGAFGGRGG